MRTAADRCRPAPHRTAGGCRDSLVRRPRRASSRPPRRAHRSTAQSLRSGRIRSRHRECGGHAAPRASIAWRQRNGPGRWSDPRRCRAASAETGSTGGRSSPSSCRPARTVESRPIWGTCASTTYKQACRLRFRGSPGSNPGEQASTGSPRSGANPAGPPSSAPSAAAQVRTPDPATCGGAGIALGQVWQVRSAKSFGECTWAPEEARSRGPSMP